MSGRQRVAFLVPGDIDQPSGGYGYDRAVITEWLADGLHVDHIALPGDFPFPGEASIAKTIELARDVASDMPLLMDGLAYGALPAEAIRRIERPVAVLLHHPLGLETGLSREESERLIATEKTAVALAHHVIVTSQETGRTVSGLFEVPPASITVALPGTRPRKRALRRRPVPLIISVGSIIPRKGHRELVAALSRIRDLDFEAVFAGSLEASPASVSAVRAAIEDAGLADRVRLAGAMDEAALDELYSEASLFALASHYEGYGMAFAEALSAGLPIVGYRAGAVPDVVPEQAGALVAPGDIDALAGALRTMIVDGELARSRADAAFEAGRKLPQWRDTARTIRDALQEKFS
jgi:glycosyltransferase involved in cell wall biosynthesis